MGTPNHGAFGGRQRGNRIDLIGLPDDVIAALVKAADQNERTLTEQVRYVLRTWAAGPEEGGDRAD